jgi:molybdopterin-guanine dinucleotide biosynthesis protein A
MGGQDKAFVTLGGQTLLGHVVQRLVPQVDTLAISSNAPPAMFFRYALPVLPDIVGGQPGPLAGIHAGLTTYPEDHLMSVAVDLPFLPRDLVARLRSGLGTHACAYARAGERHALAILWAPHTAQAVADYLNRGGRRLWGWLEAQGAAVEFDTGDDGDVMFNINTPDDLARAERQRRASS